jgi:hypothetical protein
MNRIQRVKLKVDFNIFTIDKKILEVYLTLNMSADNNISHEISTVIENPSAKLRQFAVESFPFKHAQGQVRFILPDQNGDPAKEKVELTLEYDSKHGTFIKTSGSENKAGFPNHLEVSLTEGSMDHFQNGFLPTLTQEGYVIEGADLVIITHHTRDDGGYGAGGGDYMDTGAVISRWSIWPQIGRQCTEEQKQELTAWFRRVKEQSRV